MVNNASIVSLDAVVRKWNKITRKSRNLEEMVRTATIRRNCFVSATLLIVVCGIVFVASDTSITPAMRLLIISSLFVSLALTVIYLDDGVSASLSEFQETLDRCQNQLNVVSGRLLHYPLRQTHGFAGDIFRKKKEVFKEELNDIGAVLASFRLFSTECDIRHAIEERRKNAERLTERMIGEVEVFFQWYEWQSEAYEQIRLLETLLVCRQVTDEQLLISSHALLKTFIQYRIKSWDNVLEDQPLPDIPVELTIENVQGQVKCVNDFFQEFLREDILNRRKSFLQCEEKLL